MLLGIDSESRWKTRFSLRQAEYCCILDILYSEYIRCCKRNFDADVQLGSYMIITEHLPLYEVLPSLLVGLYYKLGANY